MDSVDSAKNIEPVATDLGSKYNLQHFVFVTKYRYKMSRNPKTIAVIKKAFYDAAERHKLSIKELSFGEGFAHVHMEVSVPINMTVAKAAQLLKGYSSYIIFKEIPNHRLRYPNGDFWSPGKFYRSVGDVDLETVRDYVRKQDHRQKTLQGNCVACEGGVEASPLGARSSHPS